MRVIGLGSSFWGGPMALRVEHDQRVAVPRPSELSRAQRHHWGAIACADGLVGTESAVCRTPAAIKKSNALAAMCYPQLRSFLAVNPAEIASEVALRVSRLTHHGQLARLRVMAIWQRALYGGHQAPHLQAQADWGRDFTERPRLSKRQS